MKTRFCGRACMRPGLSARRKSQRKTCTALGLLSGIALLVTVTPAGAEPAPSYAALFQQAEAIAPRLAEADAYVKVAEGQATQASVRPNPTLNFQPENITPSRGTSSGPSLSQETIALTQTLELGGKRSARIAAAGANVATVKAQQIQVRAEYAYDLAVAYVAAEVAGRRLELAAETLSRAEEDERAARALVDAGREADLRAVQANAATTAAQADLEAARSDASETLLRLSGLVGAGTPYTSVGESLLDIAQNLKPPPLEPAGPSLAVLTAEAARETAARLVTVERAHQIPDVAVTLGARRIGGVGGVALVVGVAAPIPIFDLNRGAIAAASAQLTAADARVNAARLNADADWRVASSQALAADRRVVAATLAESAAEEAYRLSRIGYDAGRTPLLELLTARRGLTEAQSRALEARAVRVRAEAVLARLSGRVPFGGTP